MKASRNGLRIFLRSGFRDSKKQSFLEVSRIGELLLTIMAAAQPSSPEYWLVPEIGSNPVVLAPDTEAQEKMLDSILVEVSNLAWLLVGDFLKTHHAYFYGDYASLLSLSCPPLEDPKDLIAMYDRVLSENSQDDRDLGLHFLIGLMKPADLYVNCYEWEYFNFFGHDDIVERIKQVAAIWSLPVRTGIRFHERWDPRIEW